MSYTPEIENKISTLNSVTLTNVSGGTVWAGQSEDVSKYGRAGVSIWTPFGEFCDGVLTVEVSRDGSNWGGPSRTFSNTAIAQPHMWNIVEKYFRLKYTHGSTSASTLVIQTQYSVNADILLGHQLDETLIDETEAIITRSINVGQDPLGTYSNFKSDGVGFQTLDNLATGATFNSDVIDARGYTQVQTHIACDQDGTLGFKFCSTSNCSGTTVGQDGVERYLSVPYSSSGGFQLFSAPAFTPYVQYSFTNNGTATTTQLYYETKLLTKALSGQLLGLNSNISGAMIANLGRNVIVGQEPDGTFKNERKDGEVFKTTTLLGANSGYTSDLYSTHGFTQIETRIYSDQPGTLVGRWYDDVNKTQLTRVFTRPYAGTEVSGTSYFSSPVFGDYLEYEYTNGSTPQTQFNFELHFTTKAISGQILGMNDFIPAGVVANLGRNVLVGQDVAGNFKNVSVDADGDLEMAIRSPLTAFGEVQIAEMTPVIQVTYPYNINTELVDVETLNGGSVTQSDNMVVLQTSGVTSSMAEVETVNVAKYRAGQGIVARFTGIFTTGATTSDSYQIIGVGDEYNGYFFGMSGDTFGIHHRINSGTTFYPQTQWNVDTMDGDSDGENPSSMLFDPTKGNVFQIQYQWLGFGAIKFYIESNITGRYVPVHQIQYANNNTVPSSYNPTFPIYAEVKNGTSTDVLTLKSASMSAFVEGKNVITGPLQSTNGTNTGGNNGELLALTNVTVFPSGSTKTNKVVAYLKDMSIANDGANNTIVRVQIVEDPVYSVSPTYTYKDSSNSIMRVGTLGTYTPGTGKVIASFAVTQVGGITVDLSSRNIAIRPGKTIGFITQGDSSTSTELDISWVEDF